MNPHDAQFCNHCGTQDLFEGADFLSLNWLKRFLLLAGLIIGGRVLWHRLYGTPYLTVQYWTGFSDIRIWLIERFANFLIILFVFSLLSAFIPGEAGTQFRAIMFGLIQKAIVLGFKVLEQMLGFGWKLLLHATGIGGGSGKKK